MKRILMLSLLLIGSLQANNQLDADKEVIIIEHKAVSGLKAIVSAVGAGSALYFAAKFIKDLPDDYRKFADKPSEQYIGAFVSTALTGLMAYSAYKLGWEALPVYIRRVFYN